MTVGDQSKVRIDRWLWATRRFKTRSAAATACSGGKVKLKGDSAKPASRVSVGDTIDIRRRFHVETVRAEKLIEKRVSAAVAADCFVDLTSDEQIAAAREGSESMRQVVPVVGRRDPGSGRPTKRDRRQIDRLRGRR